MSSTTIKRTASPDMTDETTPKRRTSNRIANRTELFDIEKAAPRGTFRYLKPDIIGDNPHQPRSSFDPVAMAELQQSIGERGILMPLLGYSDPENPGKVVLIAGHRRLHAARALSLPRVPILLVDRPALESDELSIIDAVTENLQRSDLTAIEEGEAYRQLVDEYNWSHQKIAEKIGKSRPYVAQRVSMVNKLSPAVKERLTAVLVGADSGANIEHDFAHDVTPVTHREEVHNLATNGTRGASFDLLRAFNAIEPETQTTLANALYEAMTLVVRPLTTGEVNAAVREVKRLAPAPDAVFAARKEGDGVVLTVAGQPLLFIAGSAPEPKRKATTSTAEARQLALDDLEVARFLQSSATAPDAGTLAHLIQLYEADLQRLKALSERRE